MAETKQGWFVVVDGETSNGWDGEAMFQGMAVIAEC